jgi:uncharacterized protein YbdZ (MbtH family)
MTNPFEDENGVYLVLANHENQHSIWPASIAVPEGWEVRHDADTRHGCLDYVATHWNDLRPDSLIAAMSATERR